MITGANKHCWLVTCSIGWLKLKIPKSIELESESMKTILIKLLEYEIKA